MHFGPIQGPVAYLWRSLLGILLVSGAFFYTIPHLSASSAPTLDFAQLENQYRYYGTVLFPDIFATLRNPHRGPTRSRPLPNISHFGLPLDHLYPRPPSYCDSLLALDLGLG
jgi:hypothetical protein